MDLKAQISAGGPLLAAAGVLVALAALALGTRMGSEWDDLVFLAINGLAATVVLGTGLLAAKGVGRPNGSATALIVTGLMLTLVVLIEAADILGASGTEATVVVALIFCAIALYPAAKRSSPVCVLIAAVAFAVAFVAAIEGLVGFDEPSTGYYAALTLGLGFAIGAWTVDANDRHRSVQLVNAAGLAVLALVVFLSDGGFLAAPVLGPLVYGGSMGAGGAGPVGWEIVALLACAAVVAYAVIRREPGPGYLGALSLVYFVVLAGAPGENPSIVGWPLVLIALAAAAVVAALRTSADTPGPSPSGAEVEPAA